MHSFESLCAVLTGALRGVPVRIEHVGSTAVPGLAAKPIIDIDVVVPSHSWVPAAIAALRAGGYEHEGDLGIAGREAFRSPAELPLHHLYLVVEGVQALRDHLDLRGYLRRDARARTQYEAAKRTAERLLVKDREAYLEAKSAVVTRLLAEARSNEG